ncbi:MAG: Acetate kinase [Chlamydiae bacterium]|nr:Acetate kinase [Chlamydiota bacterium]
MILTLNVGSSSIKYTFFDEALKVLEEDDVPLGDDAVDEVLRKVPKPKIVGHRVVHGGSEFDQPTRITDSIIKKIEMLIPFSPVHLPKELAVIKKLHKKGFLQIACFDTAFHHSMPILHQHFPLPVFLWSEGVKRYGFHGLSYEYILQHLGEEAEGKKIVIAHLGSGASMAAVLNQQPFDTTMGFTPAGGIMMSSRSGDIDPGVISYLMREKGYGVSQIDELINFQSGLLGISEKSSDMKELLELSPHDEKAQMAVSLFCYSARKAIGSFAAALGGLDLLVFTGGIGEKSEAIRSKICEGLEFLDIKNKIRVIPTNEDLMIARHVKAFIEAGEV